MAQLDIAERRMPQDGRIKVKSGDSRFDIRMSTMPTQFGESIDGAALVVQKGEACVLIMKACLPRRWPLV